MNISHSLDMFSLFQDEKKQQLNEIEDKILQLEQANEPLIKQLFLLHKMGEFSTKLNELISLTVRQANHKETIFLLIENIHRILDEKTTDEQQSQKNDVYLIKAQNIQNVFSANQLHYDQKKIERSLNIVQLLADYCSFKLHISKIEIRNLVVSIKLYYNFPKTRQQYAACFLRDFQMIHAKIMSPSLKTSEDIWKKYRREMNILKASIQAQRLQMQESKKSTQGLQDIL